MSNIDLVPEEILVGRGDPVYMAHAYLTKVPVPAIVPFISAYSKPGDVVVDPFAGSGMTGVAAAICGRRALLSDISVLGRHIGSNYVNLVDPTTVRKAASDAMGRAQARLGPVYSVVCASCGEDGELAKTVWSYLVECNECHEPVNFYDSLKHAEWSKARMTCPHCSASLTGRAARVGEAPVVDYVKSACSKTQVEQPSSPDSTDVDLSGAHYPHVEITPDREMYKAQSLGKSGLTTVASFYSKRNLLALSTLREEIEREPNTALRSKLLFAFTATLTRASKRYQWSHKRPLNAANANYYVAAVFYEWNIFDLFDRKVDAVIKSDKWVRGETARLTGASAATPDVVYSTQSAASLNYADESVDYVFTDPPFGSNLFYADMALFQEGWLGEFTDVHQEAVIDRSRDSKRSAGRYEDLLTDALRECRRILKPGGKISMVFGNSSGKIWALVQRAVANAGLRIDPGAIAILNKGQRSVKGLASGFEHVATLDLILTMTATSEPAPVLHAPSRSEIQDVTRRLAEADHPSPSHLYLELLRHALFEDWSVADLDLRDATAALIEAGWTIDAKSGRLVNVNEDEVSEPAFV